MHGNNNRLVTQSINAPSSIVQIYNHIHSHPSMVLKVIQEDYVKPTVYEKIYKSILKKKTMIRHIRRTALYPYRKLYGFDTCSVKSNQSRSSCGSTRSTAASSSRRTSSDLSFSRRSSSNSTYASPRSQPLSPREVYEDCFLLENIYTHENAIERLMLIISLMQSGDIQQLREVTKIPKKINFKKVIGLLIFIVVVFCCCQSSVRVIPSDNKPSSGLKAEIQKDTSELIDMKTMLMDSGVALNIPYTMMSNMPLHRKRSSLVTSMADVLSNNLDTPIFATVLAESDIVPPNKMKSHNVVEILSDNLY